ncbi:MAG: hypothetical protein IPP91_17695 [Betaproteobacteria bacterium]|nr:hypothetical protein [Betaproteobacteria bacterium]
MRDKPDVKAINDRGFRVYDWSPDDPLADVFLTQLGRYPTVDEVGIDYGGMLESALLVSKIRLEPAAPIPADIPEHPGISYLSRHALERHYGVQAGWDTPGFFVGAAANLDDLICHWNLRAADIALWFVDANHIGRYRDIIPAWEKAMRESVAHRHEWDRRVAVWTRREDMDEVRKPFNGMELTVCPISEHSWNGRNVRPPMMTFDQVSVLGVLGRERGQPKGLVLAEQQAVLR